MHELPGPFDGGDSALREAIGRELAEAGIVLRQPDALGYADFQGELPTREQGVAAEVVAWNAADVVEARRVRLHEFDAVRGQYPLTDTRKNRLRAVLQAEDGAFRRAYEESLLDQGFRVPAESRTWLRAIVNAEVDHDPRVVALAAKATQNPEDGAAHFALEQARGDVLARVTERRAAAERHFGTVLTPDAREWLRGLVELNGRNAVCERYGVSEAVLTRLVDGVPTPPAWRDVPQDAAFLTP